MIAGYCLAGLLYNAGRAPWALFQYESAECNFNPWRQHPTYDNTETRKHSFLGSCHHCFPRLQIIRMNGAGMFTWIDWCVVAAFMLLTTLIGHRLRGRASNLDGFFLGGRNIPWWAVSVSLIATQTSALTFIAVPAAIYREGGDFRYLQMILGFILGNLLMAATLIKPYYQMKVASPYDFVQGRLGQPTAQMSRLLFLVAVGLGQSVRLLSTALILKVVTGIDMVTAIAIIAAFAVIWTWMGGITTVIWTDVIQFLVLIAGALLVLGFAFGAVPGGIPEVFRIADEQAKLRLIDLSLDPKKIYTLWVALFGAVFFQLAQNAVDQVSTQRLLCCRSLKDARKALAWAGAGNVTTLILAAATLGVIAYYQRMPPGAEDLAMLAKQPDQIFPFFVVRELPVGISGLIVAAFFAAGITTLDSALSALSHTFVKGIYQPLFPGRSEKHILRAARVSVLIIAVLLAGAAVVLDGLHYPGLLELGFKLPSYTLPPVLGFAILAWMGRGSFRVLLLAAVVAVIAIGSLSLYQVAFFWSYPIGAGIVVLIGLAFSQASDAAARNVVVGRGGGHTASRQGSCD
jgi:SSS family solute:Na+ symporter